MTTIPEIMSKLGFLVSFPAAARTLKLRKSRSKMVLEALANGKVERGNVGASADTQKTAVFFAYRGTEIVVWNLTNDTVLDMNAGEFEHTPSTFNQRKLAREAVDELRKAVSYV